MFGGGKGGRPGGGRGGSPGGGRGGGFDISESGVTSDFCRFVILLFTSSGVRIIKILFSSTLK